MTIWIIAALCAYFVKGLCGFANTLVFTSILSFTNSNVGISPIDLLLGYPPNAIMIWKERKSIRWKVCLPLIALVYLGNIPGVLFLKNADIGIIKILCGFAIMAVGIQMLVNDRRSAQPKKSSPIVMGLIGLISGVLCGLYGIGALISVYVSRATEDSHQFKANLSAVFFAENTFRIILYSVMGIFTWGAVRQALIVLPFVLIGLFLGMFSSRFLNEKMAKKVVIIMLIVSGLALVLNTIWA